MTESAAACLAAPLTTDEPVPVAIPRVLIAEIQVAVAEHYRIPVGELVGRRQCRMFARPRQVAMCLATQLTRHSKSRIGYFFERDHSTVSHALHAVERDIRARGAVLRLVKKLQPETEVQS